MNDLAIGNGATGGLIADLCAKIDLHIGSTRKLTEEIRKNRLPPAQPVFGRMVAADVATVNGRATLNLHGPTQGYFWYVRSIVVGGLSPTTVASGRADIYVIGGNAIASDATLTSIGLSDWRDESLTLPNVAFYGRGEISLRFNERLLAHISSGTSGQQYVAAVQFEQYEEAVLRESWST